MHTILITLSVYTPTLIKQEKMRDRRSKNREEKKILKRKRVTDRDKDEMATVKAGEKWFTEVLFKC